MISHFCSRSFTSQSHTFFIWRAWPLLPDFDRLGGRSGRSCGRLWVTNTQQTPWKPRSAWLVLSALTRPSFFFFSEIVAGKPLQSIVQQQVKLIGRGSGAALRAVNHSLQPQGRRGDDYVSQETLNIAWARRRRNIWSDWLFAVSRVQSRRRCFFHRR